MYINVLKQPRMKLILIINDKMPTCVCMLTLISMNNAPLNNLKHSMSL